MSKYSSLTGVKMTMKINYKPTSAFTIESAIFHSRLHSASAECHLKNDVWQNDRLRKDCSPKYLRVCKFKVFTSPCSVIFFFWNACELFIRGLHSWSTPLRIGRSGHVQSSQRTVQPTITDCGVGMVLLNCLSWIKEGMLLCPSVSIQLLNFVHSGKGHSLDEAVLLC